MDIKREVRVRPTGIRGEKRINQNNSIISSIQDSRWTWFENNHEEYRDAIDDLTNRLSSECPSYIRDSILDLGFLFPRNTMLRIELVLDTNILFAQVLGMLKGYKSSLVQMVKSGFLQIHAPPDLRTEISDTIKKKVRSLDRVRAFEYADFILSYVTLTDSIKSEIERHAYSLLGWRDPKDVVFLALTIQRGAHGILTKDLDFTSISEVKMWQMGELGKIVTGFKRGSFSIWFFAKGLPSALLMLAYVLSILIRQIVNIGGFIANGIIVFLKKLPTYLGLIPWEWVVLVLGLIAIPLVFSAELRKAAVKGIQEVMEWLSGLTQHIRTGIEMLTEVFRLTLLVLSHHSQRWVEALGYLAFEAVDLISTLNEIDELRAVYSPPQRAKTIDDILREAIEFLTRHAMEHLEDNGST